jgi:hypothetical protein
VPQGSFEDAIVARDAKLREIAQMSSRERNQISTVAGAVDSQTGHTAVGIKRSGENYGKCAEDLAVEALAGPLENALISPAIRPRTQETVPVCKRCQTKYERDQFPPETPFEE